ncbi:MAG: phosphatase PAP2 family protein [Candidatus Xenobia bacterium]
MLRPGAELTEAQRIALQDLKIPGAMVLGGAALFVLAVLFGFVVVPVSSMATYADNVMFNSLCLGIVLCYATLPYRPQEARWVIASAVAGEAVRWMSHPDWWSATMRLQGFGFVAGLACLAGLAWRAWRSEGDEMAWARGMLTLSAIMFMFPNISTWMHALLIRHTPLLYDAYAYRVDGAFGFEPAALVASLVAHHQPLWYATFLTYNELPLCMTVAVLLGLLYPERCYGRLMLHFVAIGVVGFLCYALVPMKGIDLFVGAGYPTTLPPARGVPLPYLDHSQATRNCYPSLHLGWMLAILLGVRRVSRRVRAAFLALVIAMVLATLNVGHYAVDLVAAVPFVVCFHGLINRQVRREAAGGGAALFVLFTVALRATPGQVATHPVLLAVLVALTIGGSLWLEDRMAQATCAPV